MIHMGEVIKLRLPLGAIDFLAGQGDEVVEMPDVAELQERIREHAGQRRRDRHGEPPVGTVAIEPLHHFEERDVGLGDRFVEPVFFEKVVVFGMAYVREVSVQYKAEITKRHFGLPRWSRFHLAYEIKRWIQ